MGTLLQNISMVHVPVCKIICDISMPVYITAKQYSIFVTAVENSTQLSNKMLYPKCISKMVDKR